MQLHENGYRMDNWAIAGLCATVTIVGLAIAALWGVVDGYLLGEPGTLLAPTLTTGVITVVAIGLLVLVGTRSKRWRANPYW